MGLQRQINNIVMLFKHVWKHLWNNTTFWYCFRKDVWGPMTNDELSCIAENIHEHTTCVYTCFAKVTGTPWTPLVFMHCSKHWWNNNVFVCRCCTFNRNHMKTYCFSLIVEMHNELTMICITCLQFQKQCKDCP